jgi:hypothetical protein
MPKLRRLPAAKLSPSFAGSDLPSSRNVAAIQNFSGSWQQASKLSHGSCTLGTRSWDVTSDHSSGPPGSFLKRPLHTCDASAGRARKGDKAERRVMLR